MFTETGSFQEPPPNTTKRPGRGKSWKSKVCLCGEDGEGEGEGKNGLYDVTGSDGGGKGGGETKVLEI